MSASFFDPIGAFKNDYIEASETGFVCHSFATQLLNEAGSLEVANLFSW
jgi:hypothetical protein